MHQVHWTEQEYITLAQALRQQFPERAQAQVATPEQFVFTTHEVGMAMRANFPRERQRALSKGMARKLSVKIMEACGAAPSAMRKRAAPPNGFIRWTPAEWRYYALSLVTLYPQFDLVNSRDLAQLRLNHLNKAGGMMDPGRRRTFNALGGPIKMLLDVYAEARRNGDAIFGCGQPQQAESELPVVPPKPRKVANASTCKVFWSKSEWVKVAAELHRQYPHAKYPEKNHLGSLNPADVDGAQFVLPENRRRKNLKLIGMSSLRTQLLEAFKAVRHMLVEESQQRWAEAEQTHHDMLARAATAAVTPNQWEVVFKPLIELITREVGAQLLPALIEGLHQAGHIAVPRPTPPAQLSLAPISAPPRKAALRIAIVSNEQKNAYREELDKYFPSVDFVYLNQKNFDGVNACDKVIVLIRFVSHSTTNKLRKLVSERYVPINGSASDIKRVVSGWLSDTTDVPKGAGVAAA